MAGSIQQNWLPVSSVIAFLAVAYLLISFFNFDTVGNVPASNESLFRAPLRNVWADLDAEEAREVFDLLYKVPNDLNLTENPTGDWQENIVSLVEVLHPNKSDVVPYFDGIGQQPARWARFLVIRAGGPDPKIMNYMIGPLPPNNETKILPLSYCYNSGRNYVTVPDQYLGTADWILEVVANISDITMDLLGASVNLSELFKPQGLMIGGRPVSVGDPMEWLSLYALSKDPTSFSLMQQGIYIKLNSSRESLEDNGARKYLYNGIMYNSEDEFRTAWKSAGFVKLPPNVDGPWTNLEDFESSPPGRSKSPPTMVQAQGRRYQLDLSEKYVSWMGFTFYFSTAATTGLALYDVRFKDTRIMYSLGLQEALSHYAGADPIQGGLQFFDAIFGMGASSSRLVPGYDCPAYADYLDMSFSQAGQMMTIRESICIFEYTADHPIQRHSSMDRTTVSLNTYLVLRTVASVGNYDYTIDYVFYLDGTVEVKYRASGYIFASFYPGSSSSPFNGNTTSAAQNPEYGFHIHTGAASSIHTHILHFRADLDVAGTGNTLQRVDVSPITRSYAWEQPEIPSRNTMHLTTTEITHETALNWPANSASLYVMVNNDQLNPWGEKRGYRIMPGTLPGTPAHLPIINSTSLLRSAPWASSDLFLLVQHDTEPMSSSPLSWLSPADPLVDFDRFLADNESTRQSDLVVCFNLGSHHVPTSGDVPNTLEHLAGSSVMFAPFNFFERDASRESVSGVVVDWTAGKKGQRLRYFGGHSDDCRDGWTEGDKEREEDGPIEGGGEDERIRSWIESRFLNLGRDALGLARNSRFTSKQAKLEEET